MRSIIVMGLGGLDTCLMYIPLAITLSYDHTYLRRAGKYMTTPLW